MLLDRHRAKITALAQLAVTLGARPRDLTVVMCHGVFDVVHPGHLRHLLYAKSKADLLVVSVTSDAHVPKGPYRPHVPQQLRMEALATYDFVDYVVLSDAEKPLDLIEELRPDYFAKGFEYASHGRPQGDIAEVAVVEGYGGEVLFTPGDVVYSSSELIEAAAPDLRWEKLDLAMRAAGITFADLRAAVARMAKQSVHVVGDSIVDRLSYCEMVGARAKTPTISVRRERHADFVGGAAVVAKHARAAGAAVRFTTVLGADRAGDLVLDDLRAAGVEAAHVVDRARPTTVKEAVVVDGYRVLKIDTVDSRSVSGRVLDHLVEAVASTHEGVVVFSDFRHGIFNARTIPRLAAAIPEGRLRVADSQVASRWGNITEFCDFNLVTPNEREARFALGDQDSGVRPLAERLCAEAHCDWVLMKLGARGVLGYGPMPEERFALDSFAGRVVDPVGAGDAFLAYATLGLLAKLPLAGAAILGSFAAGAECAYDGNMPVVSEAVLERIDEAEREIGA